MSWTPDPADYAAPTNEPPGYYQPSKSAAPQHAAVEPPSEPEPAEQTIGFEPPDAPTVTGTTLTENVNQA